MDIRATTYGTSRIFSPTRPWFCLGVNLERPAMTMTLSTPPELAIRPQPAPFEVWQLTVLRAWAEYHGLKMAIDLARQVDGVQCEELVILRARHTGDRWILWRTADAIMLRSTGGPVSEFNRLANALAVIAPAADEDLTDLSLADATKVSW
jgi:hypothetical protein